MYPRSISFHIATPIPKVLQMSLVGSKVPLPCLRNSQAVFHKSPAIQFVKIHGQPFFRMAVQATFYIRRAQKGTRDRNSPACNS